ncbi:MAG TPA: tautomerase family protein [Kofleriaceae bacterium]|jgi:phenylpyruvate tautomerase PptA (4-oxalocrotonate tautomerase family)|nr:tautomerase family protein [Kofleriaceae bacterium]
MPLQRISIVSGREPAYRQAIADGVHRALVETCAVPEDDRFQLITEHPAGSLICTPSYLGIAHGSAPVLVQITLNRGRTRAQKKALYARVSDLLLESAARVPRADVIMNLVEVEKEDWSFGNGIAQYAGEDT